ncbi:MULTISPECIES: flagellin [unclassified Vibrio]|uniref:Flagellin n=1 Tax=Vibrio sp. HB236076 TaxID=3232307 RepID=A0AB39HAL1_9VIBR|nr:flagellin [Vibrio sp. HB161653]MDP5254277.1 flagellin [Vibrio sp. HB161653]
MVSIVTNSTAMLTSRYLNQANTELSVSQAQLQSGSLINRASDNAAGMQISNRLTAQTQGLSRAMANASDAYSVAQTAEGALQESAEILGNLRDLSLQAANGSYQDSDRRNLNQEAQALLDELTRVANSTTYAGHHLLNGTFGRKAFQLDSDTNSISLHLLNTAPDNENMGGYHYLSEPVSVDTWSVNTDNQEFVFDYTDAQGNHIEQYLPLIAGDDVYQVATYLNSHQDVFHASVTEQGRVQLFAAEQHAPFGLNLSEQSQSLFEFDAPESKLLSQLDLSTQGRAQLAIGQVDAGIQFIDRLRGSIGGFQNRVESTLSNLANVHQQIVRSNAALKDTDVAKASTALVKSQMLRDGNSAMLSQAKQSQHSALSLLV